MKTLKQRLHPHYQTRLIFFKKEYPALGERLEHNLNTQQFIGDLTLSVAIDLKVALNLKNVTDAYECFESAEL
jgi:hypothetical protein